MSELSDRFSITDGGLPLWPEFYKERGVALHHCLDVLQGSYDIPWWPTKPVTILDIGANIGAFTRWAVKRWPNCTIHAYEPEPNNFKLLEYTVNHLLVDNPNVHIHQRAVDARTEKRTLANYGFNCGEFSLYKMPTGLDPKGSIEVDAIAATDLPKCDILKVDAEGSEMAIIGGLFEADRLRDISAIMLEYHNGDDGDTIRKGLVQCGFEITGDNIKGNHRGEIQFLKKHLLPYQ